MEQGSRASVPGSGPGRRSRASVPGVGPETEPQRDAIRVDANHAGKSVYSQDNQLKKYLKDLNAQCPCKKAKGTWAQGSWRNISAGDCKLDPDVKYPWLCLIANGSTTYGTYRWNDIGKQNVKSYSAGVVQFNQQDGYSSPYVPTQAQPALTRVTARLAHHRDHGARP